MRHLRHTRGMEALEEMEPEEDAEADLAEKPLMPWEQRQLEEQSARALQTAEPARTARGFQASASDGFQRIPLDPSNAQAEAALLTQPINVAQAGPWKHVNH